MDAVLVNPAATAKGLNESTVEPPLGLAYIAAFLEKNNFSCKIIDSNIYCLSNSQIVDEIPEETKLVGIYLNSFLYDATRSLTTLIRKKRKDIFILLGGPLPSARPESVLREIPCDGLIRGEGEYSTYKIMQNLKGGHFPFEGEVSGAAYLDRNGSIIFKPIQRISDLDALPFPAFHLLPSLGKYRTRSRKTPVGPIVTSRGCAFNCTFCSKDVYQRQVTFRGVENVLNEIDFLVKKYHVKQLDILDDNFAQNRKRMEGILDGLIKKDYHLAINMQLGSRTELLDERILKKLKKAGFFKLGFGIESADENVLRINKKALKLDRAEEVIKISKRLGFVTYGFFIIGLPGETEESFRKTIEFAKRTDVDVANFCMAIPFVGTELYRMVQEKGRFLINTTKNIDSGFYAGRVFFVYGNSTEEDLLNRYKQAYKEFYSFKKRLKIILSIRSMSEFLWLAKSFLFVARGLFNRTGRASAGDGST